MASDDKPKRRRDGKPRRPHPSERWAELYDPWSIPMHDEPDAPLVTSLHDGLDWVQVHAPREFFEHLAKELEEGRTADLEKWLLVWSMPRKDLDHTLCGAPTNRAAPCHFTRPCPYHPTHRRTT